MEAGDSIAAPEGYSLSEPLPGVASTMTEALAFKLSRLGPRAEVPLRITVVASAPGREGLLELASRNGWSANERAPRVFDVELTLGDIDVLLPVLGGIDRLDVHGSVYGAPVLTPETVATVAFELHVPWDGARAAALGELGVTVADTEDGFITGEIAGSRIAELVATPWVGPVEVRATDPAVTEEETVDDEIDPDSEPEPLDEDE
ncbi:hypothetical protein ACFL59_05085 [Planctomycetota bacterium]